MVSINIKFIKDFGGCALFLGFLSLVNHQSGTPVTIIFPYIFPVAFLTWRYNLPIGFLAAALAALPGGYLQNHSLQDLYWAGLSTYLKLSTAVAITRYVKWYSERKISK